MIKAAVSIIVADDNILLVSRMSDEGLTYETPGGHIEDGESPEDAVLREIREETGFDAVIECKLGVFEDEISVSHYYRCSIIDATQPAEGGAMMVPLSELGRYPITGFARKNLVSLGLLNGN